MPAADEAAAQGLTLDDYAEHAEVWPENWPAWCLFEEMRGQWRTAGMNGARVALDYGVLFARMDRMRLADDDWHQLYHDIRVMEDAALLRMHADT